MTKIKLNKNQIDRLSEYLGNFSLLIFGTVVVPQFIGSGRLNFISLFVGVGLTILLIVASLDMLK